MNKYFPLSYEEWCNMHGFTHSRNSYEPTDGETVYEALIQEALVKIEEEKKRAQGGT